WAWAGYTDQTKADEKKIVIGKAEDFTSASGLLRHMRADRGNACPRWPVSRSEATRHLLRIGEDPRAVFVQARLRWKPSRHSTHLADLKSHQKLHLGRPDES
ncbi:hypothetical protein ACWERY_19990, partial [Streptomyces sp. NPDC004082]